MYQLIDLLDPTIPNALAEAVACAYHAIFEDNDGGMDTSGAREPAMTEHGSVSGIGPGRHKITMGPGKTGYDIDGVHVGWANPGGKYSAAVDAQNAFDLAYSKVIGNACPKLSDDDNKACSVIMGDYDGLWYYRYDNGTGRSNRRHASDEVSSFGHGANMDDDTIEELNDEIERIALAYAKKTGEKVTPDQVSKWFADHNVKLGKDQLSEVMSIIDKKTKFYTEENERIARIEKENGVQNLEEMTVTETGLPNNPPSEEIWKNIAYMAKHLKSLREATGLPIHVDSCFRSPAVNAAVNGASTSAHLKGLAMDLNAGSEQNNRAMYKALVDRVNPWDIDQLIMYNKVPHDKTSQIRFVHVGMNPGNGRHSLMFS